MSSMFDAPVGQYASRALVSVSPDTPVADVQRLFEARDISAVPVVDAANVLRGIFSTTDLLRIARIEMQFPRATVRLLAPPRVVGDVMQQPVVTIDEAAPLRAAAAAMVAHRIHRVVVTRAGAACSVLTTRDAMRVIRDARVTEPLASVMTTELVTVDIGESIDAAVERLSDANVHGLVVVDGDFPVGVFTQREAIKSRALPPAFRQSPVEQIMSYETLCHDVRTPLYRVVGASIEMNVRRVLAVDARRVAGIATGFDLVRYLTL